MCIMKTVVKATVFLIMFYFVYFLSILAIAVLEYSVRHKQQHGQLYDSVIIPIYLLTIE